MIGFKILAFALIAIGAYIVYGANFLVKKFELGKKTDVKEAEEFTQEALESYRHTKTVVNVKMIGFFVLLAGVILLFYICR
ncbi:MAG: hypothetical protein GX957_03145 [Clostridiaceae bacterium]|nr:hypothetical protein [Clostridiaceae bacterium]